MMEIKSAEFVSSFVSYKDCPKSEMPEYAFVGRSNIGKSSLINMLLEKKKLAKTSQSPGKTQLINQFIVNESWHLVDLPGYGYAKVAKSKRKDFNKLINEYILHRDNLMCLFVLLDSRHEPQKNDLGFMRWLGENQVPFAMVFTKVDKISGSAVNTNITNYKKEMLKEWEALPPLFITSSELKTGRNEILDYIQKINDTVKTEI
ncbi:MAG TPA: YihA family ribosome biogenesis GTP-binding protein [Bacteroidales bacterium]|jgi:GTP-binding protein|nr:YihA family ribosome biogenesis GTP-binding protein [Bacteroidales bacterium]